MLYNTTKWDHIKQIQSFQTLFFKFLKTNCTPKRRLHTKENNTHSKVLVKQLVQTMVPPLYWQIANHTLGYWGGQSDFKSGQCHPSPPLWTHLCTDLPLSVRIPLSVYIQQTPSAYFQPDLFFFFKLYLHKTCYVTALCITG